MNPFTYGNPITTPSRFIGRRDELHQIITRLRSEAFESTSIVGQRRIGKTSLLKMVTQESIGEQVYHVFVDLQLFQADNTSADFWDEVLYELVDTLAETEHRATVEKFRADGKTDTRHLKRLFRQFDRAGVFIVLLLDEFDLITSNTNFSPDFFYGMRYLAIHHNLALITSSYADLSDLSHSPEIRSSPFFNIFATVHVGAFKPTEVDDLFGRYMEGTGIEFRHKERTFLTSIAGRFPYYLQIAGKYLFDVYPELPSTERFAEVKRRFSPEVEDTLEYTWRHASDGEKISLMVLALLTTDSEQTLPGFSKDRLTDYYQNNQYLLDRLTRQGLVDEQESQYALFSTVFAEWIRQEIKAEQLSSQSYKEWLNQPPTQNLLARLKGGLGTELTEQILPHIKEIYREQFLSWITNPATVTGAIGLLRLLVK
ncbi:AAA family ATPase [Anaerolineales bacterium HSG25]|nr:AAA family ATPase [Anaerolineales bacterium HSG25]